MGGEPAKLIITDPPYNVNYEGGTGLKIKNDNMGDSAFSKLAECLMWVKNALVLGRQDYHWRHEPILYGWSKGAAHHWYGDRDKDTVLEDKVDIGKLKKDEVIALLKELLKDRENTHKKLHSLQSELAP